MSETAAGMIECRLCLRTHSDRYLCDPGRDLIEASYRRGDALNVPAVEFGQPRTPEEALGGDRGLLVSQLLAAGALIEVSGVQHPALILTGRDGSGAMLPQWTYPGGKTELRAIAKLITRMTELAISHSETQLRGG